MNFSKHRLEIVFFSGICYWGIISSFAQQCNILYATPFGSDTGNAGTKENPGSLTYAFSMADSINNQIRIAEGNYIISNELIMKTGLILEGGFDSVTWDKTNTLQTIIYRDTNNISSNPNRLVGVECANISGFGIYDLQISVANAIGDGVSAYGLHISNCFDYTLARITVLAGNGSDGYDGINGVNGVNGANGQIGEPGDEDGPCCTAGGAGGDSSFFGNNAGGKGGNGGQRGTGVCFGGGGTAFSGDTALNGNGNSGGIGGIGGQGVCVGTVSFSCDATPASIGADGSDGGNGFNGFGGDSGVISFEICFLPGNGNDGQSGENGSGGGGGGGGGSQGCLSTCFGTNNNGAGPGGGGGGEGGQGGTGATGGNGGGGSFGIYLDSNGINSFLKDSYFDSGMQGIGGAGGTIGGIGGSGGSGGGSTMGCDIGTGGNGGSGGNGGNGGIGGNGVTGVSLPMFEDTSGIPISQSDMKADSEPAIIVKNSGCTFSNIELITNATGVIEWLFDSTASSINAFGDSVSIQYLQKGRHTITLSVDGFPYIFSDFVGIFYDGSSVPPTISGVDSVCAESVATFSTSNADSLEWKIYDSGNIFTDTNSTVSYTFSAPGIYYITLQTISSCCGKSLADTFEVTVLPLQNLDVTLYSNDSLVCSGDSVIFTATPVNGGNNPFFQWFVNGDSAGFPSNSFSSVFNNGDTIICEVTSSATCPVNSPAISLPNVITVTPKPTILLSATDDSICFKDTVIFTASPTGFNNYEFFQDSVSVQNGPSNVFIISPFVDLNNIFVIAVNNGCISDASSTFSITVNQIPFAQFIANSTNILVGDTVFFTSVSPGINNASYLWDFGDGFTSVSENPYHIYSASGEYSVTLVVTSPEGCSDTFIVNNYISVSVGQEEFWVLGCTFQVYPNPFNSEININLNSETVGILKISVKNVLGQTVFTETIKINESMKSISFPITPLSNGEGSVERFSSALYLFELDFNGTKQHSRLIYQK